MNLDSRFSLQAGVQFRCEDFGGIVYKRKEDRLHFVNPLAAILLSLADSGTVLDMAAKFRIKSLNEQGCREQILKTLRSLEELEIIHEVGS